MARPDRLYVVVRGDLAPGLQVAQAMHAFRQFVEDHPDTERRWFADSNTLAVLTVPSEGALASLVMDAVDRDLRHSKFHEPDLGGALTAIALEPGATRIVRTLPLALEVIRPE